MPQATCSQRTLFAWSAAGDQAAREALAERFLPLARSVARRYAHSDEPLDDLVQVACVGLMLSLDRFDPERGISFTSFAVPTILGEIKRHFRDRTWSMHVPRALNELSLKVDDLVRNRTQATGQAPTVAELCAATECSDEQVLEAIEVGRARRLPSLNAALRGSDGDDAATVGELVPSARADRDCEERDARLFVGPLLNALPPRDELIVRLRFEKDMTQAEIGKVIGVSQMQVSRLLRRALKRLHEHAGSLEPAIAR